MEQGGAQQGRAVRENRSRLSWRGLTVPLFSFGLLAAASAETDGEACADALEASLAALLDGPVVKDEIATAVMWLRLDAEEAATAGDHRACIANAETALMLTLNNQGRSAED